MINHAIRFIEADFGKTMEALLSDYLSLQQEAANERTSGERLKELAKIGTDLARRVAKNPSAPPELLKQLARCNDATTRSHVTANPNTPTEVLRHLGGEFPEQLIDNPIFPLLWLENPNLARKMPFTTLASLLQQERVPVFFLEQTANHWDRKVQLTVAMHPQTPRTALEKLVRCRDAEVAEAAQLHVNWAGEITEGWEEVVKQAFQTTVLRPVIVPKHQEYIEELAKIGSISESIIESLPRTYRDNFLQAVARGANNLPHRLEQWARDNKWEFRRAVATNPNTPVSILKQLGVDHEGMVRREVAKNPNTPVSLLEQLALDIDVFVRKNVAENPGIPVSVLEHLAKDEEQQVRVAVALNSKMPASLPEPLVLEQDVSLCTKAAKYPNTPVNCLELLAKDENVQVRENVAKNPSTPERLLKLLVQDKTVEVRCGVAQNPNASERLLRQLMRDYTWKVRLVAMVAYLAQNPDALPTVLEHQVAEKPEHLPLEWVHYPVVCSASSFIRPLILLHPQISGKALAENSRSLAWLERYAIAQHLNTPLNTLKLLALDGNRIVRAAARANLVKASEASALTFWGASGTSQHRHQQL